MSYHNNIEILQIEGLKQLKRMLNVSKVDCIPSSITKLSIKPSFHYKELLEKNKDCFENIKELEFEWSHLVEDFEVFLNFSGATKIKLLNEFYFNHPFKIPIGIKELIFGSCCDKNQTVEIAKLTGLKKLSIIFDSTEEISRIKEMNNNLKELEWLKTNYNEEIQFPTTLTFLNLVTENSCCLSQYANLKELELLNETYYHVEISLPTKLNKLSIQGNIVVTNSKEIEVKKLIFNDSEAQLCEWKSKIIIIENDYQASNEEEQTESSSN